MKTELKTVTLIPITSASLSYLGVNELKNLPTALFCCTKTSRMKNSAQQ